jgi:predicted amidohydrolase
MRICVAQSYPATGDINANIDRHMILITHALDQRAQFIVFPELSLTGYEPALARSLAMDASDRRLDVFQAVCESHGVTVGIGAPTRGHRGTQISLLFFQPGRPRQQYAKHWLHEDELPYFVAGPSPALLIGEKHPIAPAICYEISVPQHALDAKRRGANVYVASVAKTTSGIEQALIRLQAIASEHAMTVLMSNCVGLAEGSVCAGKSTIWNKKGEVVAQLDANTEGIILLDLESGAANKLSW